MNEFSDSQLALQNALQEDPIQKKIAMDALRKRIAGEPDKEKQLREACQGFEAIFIQKVWEQMRKNVPKEGYLHSRDEETYQSMFDQELAKKMSSAGGIGLADMMYEQLSQKLGESSRTTLPSRLALDPNLGNLERPFVPAALDERNPVRPLAQKAPAASAASPDDIYQPFIYPEEAQSAADTASAAKPADASREGPDVPARTAEQASPLAHLDRVPDSQDDVVRYFNALEQSVRAEAARRAAAQGTGAEVPPSEGKNPFVQRMHRDMLAAARFMRGTPDGDALYPSSVQSAPASASASARSVPSSSALAHTVASSALPTVPETSVPSSGSEQSLTSASPSAETGHKDSSAVSVAPGSVAPTAVREIVAPARSPVVHAPLAAASSIQDQGGVREFDLGQKNLIRNISDQGHAFETREFSGPSFDEQRALAAVALAEKMRTQKL